MRHHYTIEDDVFWKSIGCNSIFNTFLLQKHSSAFVRKAKMMEKHRKYMMFFIGLSTNISCRSLG